jgi:hypothetical protein
MSFLFFKFILKEIMYFLFIIFILIFWYVYQYIENNIV